MSDEIVANKKFKVVVYMDGKPVLDKEFDSVNLSIKRGMKLIYRPGVYSLADIEPNGQEIMSIKASVGCSSYETFVERQEEHEPRGIIKERV